MIRTLAALFISLVMSQICLAQTPPKASEKIMVVLDSSGSMWGQIDGKTKREIAQSALSDMAAVFPDTAHIGLMAYGHRKKGDCSDIELLYAPETDGAQRLGKTVSNVKPMGKTPLSAAVRKAAETMKYEEEKSTVILITDGLETCNLDPCAVGTELEAAGIDFTAHIVGFGLSKEEGRQVACLAENTGGRYIQASDAGELSDALETVVEVVEQTPAPSVAPPQNVLATFRALGDDGKLIDHGVVSWRIISQSGIEPEFSEALLGYEEKYHFPAGPYLVKVQHGQQSLEKMIEITSDGENIFDITFKAGTIRLVPRLAEGRPPLTGVYWWKLMQNREDGTRKEIARTPGSVGRFTVPPGIYDVEFETGNLIETHKEVTVISDSTTEEDVIINAAILRVHVTDGEHIGSAHIHNSSGEKIASDVFSSKKTFILPEGDYKLSVGFRNGTAETEFNIVPGGNQTITVSVVDGVTSNSLAKNVKKTPAE